MQTDDEQFLQISLRPDNVDQLDKLYEEAMEEPILESFNMEGNPRDGLQSSISEPTLPNLGPGDIKVTVVTSMESNPAAEEIVHNKPVRVDEKGQSSKTSKDHIICRGCNAVGHVLESCPKDHGLKFTDCQMYQMKQTNASAKKTKSTGTGIDQLSSCFQKLANSPLHTGIFCQNFFHSTIIPPWRVSLVSREGDKVKEQ